jgi:hypothetical protein
MQTEKVRDDLADYDLPIRVTLAEENELVFFPFYKC